MFICHRCLGARSSRPLFQRLEGLTRRTARRDAVQFTTWRAPAHERGQVQHGQRAWRRRATTKISVRIDHIPQGALPESAPMPVEESLYPELLRNVRKNMEAFAHCVLLTRVGNFYEMYFEQAEQYGPLLSLKVGKRTIGSKPNKRNVAMAGFPYFQLDRFLKILVQDLNKHVAIVEEIDKGKDMPKDRKIDRVVTPGTLIDEKFMDPLVNNYLLSIRIDGEHLEEHKPHQQIASLNVGIAWLDLSSGDFFTQHADLDSLGTLIARIAPRELLLESSLQDLRDPRLSTLLQSDRHTVTFVDSINETEVRNEWLAHIEPPENSADISRFSELEKAAATTILRYVNVQLQGKQLQLLQPLQKHEEDVMVLDRSTLRALEIRETLRDGLFQGSLLQAVRGTVTKSGARLLSQRLCAPSRSLHEINCRLDLVSELIEYPALHESLRNSLNGTADSLRLLQKFSFGRGDADDLLGLSRTVQATSEIAQTLSRHCEQRDGALREQYGDQHTIADPRPLRVRAMLDRLALNGPLKLCRRISNAIDEERLLEQHIAEDREAAQVWEQAEAVLSQDGEAPIKGVPKGVRAQSKSGAIGKTGDEPIKHAWIMQRSASAGLTRLHDALDSLRQEEVSLQQRLRDRLGAGVSLRWTPGLEYICHVKGSLKGDMKDSPLGSARLVRSSKSTQSYHLPEWMQLGNRIDKAKLHIEIEERRIFAELRTEVVRNLVHLRRNAGVLDELDVAYSFAKLARENRLTRPKLNNGHELNIVGGRHATVEGGLTKQGRNFTTNNCQMSDKERVLLITGPNMGGKSTFLRQNALIAILAQTGSYVPAEYAEIGLIDKVFTRVGSADNLYQDQSTFMVEMLETADILKQATERSFVIMDEVGRGTTPEDGVAIGFAALHHLYHFNKSRVLFATHFHVLTDMVKDVEGISCYCTDIEEAADGSWTFVHRLTRGINRHSHALRVAQLAGLPQGAINVAAKVLKSPLEADFLQVQESAN